METHRNGYRLTALVAILAALIVPALPALASPIDDPAFWRTWARTDKPIAEGHVIRTWIWGPEAITGLVQEPYGDSSGDTRTVQYFDKSRMEINDPARDPGNPWQSLRLLRGRANHPPIWERVAVVHLVRFRRLDGRLADLCLGVFR